MGVLFVSIHLLRGNRKKDEVFNVAFLSLFIPANIVQNYLNRCALNCFTEPKSFSEIEKPILGKH